MPIVQALLHLLERTGPQTIERLESELNVSSLHSNTLSDANFDEALTELIALKVVLQNEATREVCLNPEIGLLRASAIESRLRDGIKEKLLLAEVMQSVNSTNSYLLNQAITLDQARLCVSESQQQGRGRRGNDWQSTPYRNLMLSMSWGFADWPDTITGLGLAVALVITQRLNKQFDLNAKIKWPNDILVDDKKLAGVLIDVAGQAGGVCNVVIGLGLNVDQNQPSTPRGDLDYDWQDLKGMGISIDRNTLIAELVGDLIDMLGDFAVTGFAPMTHDWNQMSSYADRQIRVIDQEHILEGRMQGVDPDGALVLVDEDQVKHRITDSSVSVRLVA